MPNDENITEELRRDEASHEHARCSGGFATDERRFLRIQSH